MLFFDCKKDHSQNLNTVDLIVDNNKVWYVTQYIQTASLFVCYHKIVFGHDTTINLNSYKIILDYSCDSTQNHNKPRSLGYMRETSDKKVYWRPYIATATEILLYDFNPNINDTIDNWIVSSIDTIKVLNINRKKITLRNCQNTNMYFIDGIGDMSDLLNYESRITCDYKNGLIKNITGGSRSIQTKVMQGNNIIFDKTINKN